MKYLDSKKGTMELYFSEEEILSVSQEYVDVKIFGPVYRQIDRTTWYAYVLVNLTLNIQKNATNIYSMHDKGGLIGSWLTVIPVTNTLNQNIGCLVVSYDKDDSGIIQENIGKASPSANLHRFVTEAMFKMELTK
jgi:hypothetical protein